MKSSQSASEATAKQKCTVRSLDFSNAAYVALYVAGLFFFAYKRNWTEFSLWLLLLPALKWTYVVCFPRISKWKGYGGIEDDKHPTSVNKVHAEVTYYRLLGCPFCPIVQRRLETLQREMDFTLMVIDLTLKPQVAANKGIRSVAVVEVGGNRLVGNATTEQLAELIAGAKVSDAALRA